MPAHKGEFSMRFGAFVWAAMLPITLTACGQRDRETSTEANEAATNEVAAGNDAAAVEPSGAQAFVNKAAASDRFEIETSRLVAGSAASSAVMAFAREMIAAHTASSAKLKATLGKEPSEIVIDDKLSPSQQAALDDMKMKKGYIFDAAYVAAQVHGHDETLTELKNYAASGDNAALKEFARDMIPTVEQHLSKAKNLK
jgi:putative membrane protein